MREHQSETLLHWLLWILLERIRRVLPEKTPHTMLEADSCRFRKYVLLLFENECYVPSTIISHWIFIASILWHWKYNPVTDPHTRVLLCKFKLPWLVELKLMPQWDLHLILAALVWLPSTDGASDKPSNDIISLKWRMLTTTFVLSLATAT